MLDSLLLHDQTTIALRSTINSNNHAIMLIGPPGAGKLTIARYLAAEILDIDIKALSLYPYFRHISEQNKTITIDQIRNTKRFLLLKTTGQKRIQRIILIENAHLMTKEAQNAFLKELEEPPFDTIIILTTMNQTTLLATIHSRVQEIVIQSPSVDKAIEFYKKEGFSEAHIRKSYLISNGQIGLLSAILMDDTSNELIVYIDKAKLLLQTSAYDRMLRLDEFSKDKNEAVKLIEAFKVISYSSLNQAALNNHLRQAKHWSKILEIVHESERVLPLNPNIKLVLTNLFINI